MDKIDLTTGKDSLIYNIGQKRPAPNRDNYHNQTIQFNRQEIDEDDVLTLLSLIEKYKKGLEQEVFAK